MLIRVKHPMAPNHGTRLWSMAGLSHSRLRSVHCCKVLDIRVCGKRLHGVAERTRWQG